MQDHNLVAQHNNTMAAAATAPPLTRVIFLSPSCYEARHLNVGGDDAEMCNLERAMSNSKIDSKEAETGGKSTVKVDDSCGYRSLLAKRPIPRGSMVLLEHALTVPMQVMQDALRHDEGAFNLLYPRDNKKCWADHIDKNSDEMNELLHKKIACNAIGHASQLMNLGLAFSAINHAFPSNCALRTVRVTKCPMEKDMTLVVLYVVAKRDIEIGEEINVTYATHAEAEHPFIGTPSKEAVDQEAKVEESALSDTKLLFRIIDQYLHSKRWIEVSCRHKLMTDGVYLAPNYLVMAEKFIGGFAESFRLHLVEALFQGHKSDDKEFKKFIGEAGSHQRKHLEIEALFKFEWMQTITMFSRFEFAKEHETPS